MAELADALDSGSSRGSSVKVQVLLPAYTKSKSELGTAMESSDLFFTGFPMSYSCHSKTRIKQFIRYKAKAMDKSSIALIVL